MPVASKSNLANQDANGYVDLGLNPCQVQNGRLVNLLDPDQGDIILPAIETPLAGLETLLSNGRGLKEAGAGPGSLALPSQRSGRFRPGTASSSLRS